MKEILLHTRSELIEYIATNNCCARVKQHDAKKTPYTSVGNVQYNSLVYNKKIVDNLYIDFFSSFD